MAGQSLKSVRAEVASSIINMHARQTVLLTIISPNGSRFCVFGDAGMKKVHT